MTPRIPSIGDVTRRLPPARRAAAALLLLGLVALAGAGRLGPSTARAATASVTIKDFSFTPKETKVKVGDTVTWTNRETNRRTHTVIQDDGDWSSDGNRPNDPDAEIKPGASFSRTFDQDNVTYAYHCRLHGYMTGTIVVGKGSPPGQPPPPPQEQPTPAPPPPSNGPLPPLPPPPPPLLPQARTRTQPTGEAVAAAGVTPPAPGGAAAPADGLPPVVPTAAPRPAYQPTELPQGRPDPGTLGDGTRLAAFTVDKEGVKEFHLRMAPMTWTSAPAVTTQAWAFNGSIPGPLIRVNEGDRVRIVVRNDLPIATAVHWHGMILPNDQDGVPGITQPEIEPGTSYTYQWTAVATGTHWYHTHSSGRPVGLGLYGPLEVVPRQGDFAAERDYRVMIGDTFLGLVMNGRTFPYTIPLKAKVGERVHIRLFDAGDQIHPIHLHGFPFQLVARDGQRLPVPEVMDTILIGTGQTYDLIWQPMSPGHWLFHCHIFAHSHDEHGMTGLVTTLDVDPSDSPAPAVPALPVPLPRPAPPALGGGGGTPALGGALPLSGLPALSRVGAPSGGLLDGHEELVIVVVGLLVAFRLGRRAGPRHGQR